MNTHQRLQPRRPASAVAMVIGEHPVVRTGLAGFIAATCPGLRVVEAGSLEAALHRLTRRALPRLIICDLALADPSGQGPVERIVAACPHVPVLAMMESDVSEAAAKAAGAHAVLTRAATPQAFGAALHRLLGSAGGGGCNPGAQPGQEVPAAHPLPRRMEQIADLCAAGHRNKEIARILGISENTVRAHISGMLARFQLRSRKQLGQLIGQQLAPYPRALAGDLPAECNAGREWPSEA